MDLSKDCSLVLAEVDRAGILKVESDMCRERLWYGTEAGSSGEIPWELGDGEKQVDLRQD